MLSMADIYPTTELVIELKDLLGTMNDNQLREVIKEAEEMLNERKKKEE